MSKFYIGHSSDQVIRFKASSGGIGTMLIKYLLSQEDYNTAVDLVFDIKNCKYVPRLVYAISDINICGSVYQDIDIASFIKKNLHCIKGGIIVTCMPCQVKIIRHILEKNKIKSFIISFCCSGQISVEGTWTYYRFLHIDKHKVINMQYRGNGWPSGIQITLNNGETITKENYSYPWSLIHRSELFKPQRCFLCKLDVSYDADVSLADPWLDFYKKNDSIGNTFFIVNTVKGDLVIDNLIENKFIQVIPSTYKDYLDANGHTVSKKKNCSKSKRNMLLKKISRHRACAKMFSISPIILKSYLLGIRIILKFY